MTDFDGASREKRRDRQLAVDQFWIQFGQIYQLFFSVHQESPYVLNWRTFSAARAHDYFCAVYHWRFPSNDNFDVIGGNNELAGMWKLHEVNPLVPDAHYSERWEKWFRQQIKPLEVYLKFNCRFLFVAPSGLMGKRSGMDALRKQLCSLNKLINGWKMIAYITTYVYSLNTIFYLLSNGYQIRKE